MSNFDDDPFAVHRVADGGSTTDEDPFGQPQSGGEYPKIVDLNGCLLLLTPAKIDTVPAYGAKNGETEERLTADLIVVDGPTGNAYIGEAFDSMWFNQGSIVKSGRLALKNRQGMILGRLVRVPTKETRIAHNVESAVEYEGLLERWDFRRAKAPSFAWVLREYTPEDAVLARKFLK
jgi:hypothetical protein